VLAAVVGMIVAGAHGTALAMPDPSDPECWVRPYLAQCLGNAAGVEAPTGPADSSCISQPADPVCAGGPYAPPTPAPPPVIAPPPMAPLMPSPAMGGGMGIAGMPGTI
jgi:hypothetical protein